MSDLHIISTIHFLLLSANTAMAHQHHHHHHWIARIEIKHTKNQITKKNTLLMHFNFIKNQFIHPFHSFASASFTQNSLKIRYLLILNFIINFPFLFSLIYFPYCIFELILFMQFKYKNKQSFSFYKTLRLFNVCFCVFGRKLE